MVVNGAPRRGSRPGRRMRDALRASAPVDHLGFVHLVPRSLGGGEARGRADRAVDIHHPAAGATDQMMVVVTSPVLVARGRPRGLDAADEALLGEECEGIVDGLTGYDPDPGSHRRGHVIRGGMRPTRHRREHGESLGCDLHRVLPKDLRWIEHSTILNLILDHVKYLM